MDVAAAIERFLDHRAGRQVAASTICLYRRQLATWCVWRQARAFPLAIAAVELDELDAFATYLACEHVPHGENPRRPAVPRRGFSPETCAAYRRVMRAFWRFCGARSWLRPEQLHYFGPDGVAAVPVPERPRPIYADDAALRAACGDGDDETSARDRALVSLLWESGARIAELLSLDDAAVELERRRARVRGKGGRHRYVRWGPIAHVELLRYLQRRRGGSGGPLFRATGPRAGSQRRLTTDAARSRFKRLLAAAGIEPAPGSPFHAFRRSFIQRGLDDGVSLADVSQLASHGDVRTTMRYARRDEDRLDAIYEAGYVQRTRRRRAAGDT